MRKTCTSVLMAMILAASLSAFDAGGAVDSLTSVGGTFSDAGFTQSGRLSLWLGSTLGENAEFYLQGGASVSTGDPLFLADLDLAYLKAVIPVADSATRLMKLTAGRFTYQDFSGNLLSHALDGISFEFLFPSVELEVLLGYTGNLLRENMAIALSKEDVASTKPLGPKRLIGSVSFMVPDIFAEQNFSVALMAQEDLRALFGDVLPQEGDTTLLAGRGGLLDTQYIGAGFDGPLTSELYYDLYGFLNTGRTLSYIGGEYVNSAIFAYLAGFRARYYLEDLYYTRISLDTVFASGDADFEIFTEGNTAGNANAFVPLSQHQSGTVVSPQLSNLIKVRLAYSVKPLAGREDNFNAEVGVTPYFRPTAAPVSETGVLSSPVSNERYLGTEIDLQANYRPFSDLYLSLATGLFLPNGDTFYAGYDEPRFLVSLAATLDF